MKTVTTFLSTTCKYTKCAVQTGKINHIEMDIVSHVQCILLILKGLVVNARKKYGSVTQDSLVHECDGCSFIICVK